MTDFFGDYKRPKAEMKIIDQFIKIYYESKREYKSNNYQKALSGFKDGYEILKDIYVIYPKALILYYIIKTKLKLSEFKDCEFYIKQLSKYLPDLIKYKKDSFIKFKSKLFLYEFILFFTYDNIEQSINVVIEMITFLKGIKIFTLEEKIRFFWIYIKGFVKISDNLNNRKFLYFKEQYESMLVEEVKENRKNDERMEIREKKIFRGFLEDYKSYMNSKIRQIIYEHLDKKFYYYKYGEINSKIMLFLNRNMDLYINSDCKDKLIEKFNNYLLITKIDLYEKYNMSMIQLIQEQKRRISAFKTIFSNIVGAFNHIFKNNLTSKEIIFKQISHSKSMQFIYGKKEIKEIEENIIKKIKTIKPLDSNSKKNKKLNSLNMKEISFPYNFKKEIFIPPSINEVEKINNIIRKKKTKINKFNMSVLSNLPFLKHRKSLLSKNEENKNSILKPKKLLRMNRSLINITKKSVSELFNANLNTNKKKKESVNEQFKYRNFNFYFITKLIETYENMYQNQEINIKNTNNNNSLDKYSKIFPRKIDLYNFNVIKSITDHNTVSIEGTISKYENQDKHFFYEDFLLIKNFYLFGICDGHGKYGDAIAKTVSFLLPSFIAYILIEDNLNKKKQDINEMIINLFKLEESPKEIKDIFLLKYIIDKFEINYKIFPFISSDMNKLSHLLYESCHYVQKDLTQRYNYNIEYSGTTLCSAFLLGKILYVSNIGNSRIILGNYNPNLNKWNSHQLSFEHTPTSPDEIKRIMAINSKVTIARNEEEIEPYQTCDKEKESVLPGISLSRSIGDSFAKDLGVIYEPETFKYNLNRNDKIIVVGSYGFWIYMNNDEVINIIGKYYEDGIKAEEASVNIVEIAKNKWIEENIKNPSFFTNKYKYGNNGINGKENKKDSFVESNISHIYDSQKEKKYYYDDITCMIIYLDIK